MKVYKQTGKADSIWRITGSFGRFDAPVTVTENGYAAENGIVAVKTETEKYQNGVCVRKGTVKNISAHTVSINTLSSKFMFDGGEYGVYTQSNSWQHESEGGWQPLTTTVSSYSESLRAAAGAVPFMVLWSEQQNRGTAFHFRAYSAWEMHITRTPGPSECTYVEVEMGIFKDGLDIKLAPGECMEMDDIIYYEVRNKTDLDCWKLHSYLNKKYPRKTLPVIYNSWLYKFDRFTCEDIEKQIEKAKELGVEYFVIDAGWFGHGVDWWLHRGDWEENLHYGFRGKMREIADEVRKNGMKFGLWIEAECAAMASEIVKEHPEYFVQGKSSYFVDFANKVATDYIFEKTCSLIDTYGAEFIKFDFNDDLYYDKYNSGFTEYFKGHRNYICRLREKYPDIYLEDCASGGMRLTLRDGELYDGFWPTDNQSPYASLRIFKDTLLRMPPQWLEGWISVRSAKDFSHLYGTDDMADKLFATNDATWTNIVSIEPEYLFAFMKGRAVALSFDLASLTDEVFAKLKEYIENFKKERSFWQNAVCHILTDTKTMLVLEFRNEDFSKIEIVSFSAKCKQDNICVYPVLDEKSEYKHDGETVYSGAEITQNGIDIPVKSAYLAQTVKLEKVQSV